MIRTSPSATSPRWAQVIAATRAGSAGGQPWRKCKSMHHPVSARSGSISSCLTSARSRLCTIAWQSASPAWAPRPQSPEGFWCRAALARFQYVSPHHADCLRHWRHEGRVVRGSNLQLPCRPEVGPVGRTWCWCSIFCLCRR